MKFDERAKEIVEEYKAGLDENETLDAETVLTKLIAISLKEGYEQGLEDAKEDAKHPF